MSAVLIARFKSKREANLVARLIKRYRSTSTVITGMNIEDAYLGEMVEEGMREKGSISLLEFKKYLDKRIKASG